MLRYLYTSYTYGKFVVFRLGGPTVFIESYYFSLYYSAFTLDYLEPALCLLRSINGNL